MKSIFGRFLSSWSNRKASVSSKAHPSPDSAFIAIGDIHGRLDLLLQLETMILDLAPGLPAVLVGDYIDRGEQSRDVLELLSEASPEGDQPVTCLMGNHEEMCLKFLANPEEHGAHWLRNGGLQTMASFGISGVPGRGDAAQMREMRDQLAEAMGAKLLDWLKARPLSWSSGNVWAVHAGADPALPMRAQPRDVLLWGHRRFADTPRSDGAWVVHGHSIVDHPCAQAGRIAIDTGAYATGHLSAAVISDQGVAFLTVGQPVDRDALSNVLNAPSRLTFRTRRG